MIVVSKTFTTAETMLNARTMKDWLISSIKGKSATEITNQHIVSASVPLASLLLMLLGWCWCSVFLGRFLQACA